MRGFCQGGGANWPGAAVDAEEGIIFIPSLTVAIAVAMERADPNRTNFNYTRVGVIYPPGPRGLPLLKPPYGRVTAIDLNRGVQAWMTPNGDGPRDHPAIRHLNLPPLGVPGRAAPLLTKTLLFVGEGKLTSEV